MSSNQQRFILDGVPVSTCEGAFTRRFDMETKDAEAVTYDDIVVMIVVARVALPGFRQNKEGEVVRINKFEVQAARVAPQDMGDEIAEMFDLEVQQKLPFTTPVSSVFSPVLGTPAVMPPAASQAAGVVPNGHQPVTVPRGTPVPTAAPGAGTHANDAALRSFLDA